MTFKYKITIIFCILLFILSGCKNGLPIGADVKETKIYSLPQSMIVVATERNRYQQIYTDEIWSVTLENDSTFQDFLLNQVRTFLQHMKTITLLANEHDITLTSAEKDQIRRLSQTYYDGLTAEDMAYMGIDLNDVITIYQEYYLANKVMSELTKELDLEVSDSEAKVITIQQIQVPDSDTANQVYTRVTEEGSDFTAIAREVSQNPQIERQLGKNEEDREFEDAAFALIAGEISPVILSGGNYFILKCVSEYEENATAERKTQIYEERKHQVFNQIYEQFQLDHNIVFSDDMWRNITFSPQDQTTTTNFFELYMKEFGSQGY